MHSSNREYGETSRYKTENGIFFCYYFLVMACFCCTLVPGTLDFICFKTIVGIFLALISGVFSDLRSPEIRTIYMEHKIILIFALSS